MWLRKDFSFFHVGYYCIFHILSVFQITESGTVEVLGDLLVDLVNTTQPSTEQRLFGGDLRTLVDLMSTVAERSSTVVTGLQPKLDRSTTQSLADNITAVGLLLLSTSVEEGGVYVSGVDTQGVYCVGCVRSTPCHENT